MEFINKVLSTWLDLDKKYGKGAAQTEELYVSPGLLTKYHEILSKWRIKDNWYGYRGFKFKLCIRRDVK